MPQYTLHQLAVITGGKLIGDKNRVVDALETDSRTIRVDEKCMFIAIKGPRHDGHDHIPEMISKGIRNYLVEYVPPASKEIPGINYIVVSDTVESLQKIAAHYRSGLSMPVVAITGSNGKTVVKEWLAQCLARVSRVSRSPKSYNSQVGVPLSVWLIHPQSDWALIEAGISMPGEMQKLEKTLSPDYGIITNIGPPHQENFSSLEEKAREKLKLFAGCKCIYYCRDHALIHQLISREERSPKTISWSRSEKNSFVFVAEEKKSAHHTSLTIHCRDQIREITTPFTDEASLENCLHIISFLYHQGVAPDAIQSGLSALVPVAMRLEQVSGTENCTLINDSYNSDLQSLRIALDYLLTQKQHQKHALILSDIRQSGLSPEELYTEVFRMLRSYPVDPLIVVGNEIRQSKALPDAALSFATTEELLAQLSVLDFRDRTILIKGAREFGFERIVRALSEKKHTTILEINLANLVFNLNYFRSLLQPETRLMVMVKALSYGSGSFEIANLLQHQKVDYLGVAFTDEGVELRKAGIVLPIMVMAPSEESFDEIIEYRLEPEIYNFEGLQTFSRIVSQKQLPDYPVHIKLDTGMHRLGFMEADMESLAKALKTLKNIQVKAVFSHLAVSDNPKEDPFTRKQFALFRKMYDFLSGELGHRPIRHILNSAGIERFPEAHYEMVRLGIGLHGISSDGAQLKTVSTLKTRITQIKRIPSTETIGYNRHGILDRDSDIAIIPIGYADGLDRKLGNRNGQVIIGGRKVPFIGDICMDLSMIDITDVDAHVGDEVIIFGKEHPIQEPARQTGTIPYEILTNVSSRVKRKYINE